MGRDIQPPRIFYFGGDLIYFTGLVFPGPPGIFIFFSGIPFIEKYILGGLGNRKVHYFGKMEFIDFTKVVIGTPCNTYILKYLKSNIF